MKMMALDKAVKWLLLISLTLLILYVAKPVLAPFTIALLLAMLFYPLAGKMERRGISRAWSSGICVLLLLLAIAGLALLIYFQFSSMAQDLPKMKQHGAEMLEKAKEFISNTMGIDPAKQEAMLKEQQQSGGGKSAQMVTTVLAGLSGVLLDTVLVLVYIFLLLLLRSQFRKALLAMVPVAEKNNASTIISKATEVATKYLGGLSIMIVMLWVMFGIGFSIVGVDNALFFAVLCGTLEIIPFVGNIAGTGITMLMALSQGGGGNMVLGVLVTYFIVQFIQSYLIEPLVVGSEVNINPLFTILGLVAGELLWGIPGMVVALPVIGMLKVVFDHIEPLKPLGQIIGTEKKKDEGGFADKIKRLFKKK